MSNSQTDPAMTLRLRDYVQHKPDCAIELWVFRRPRPDCTCGLDALLAEPEKGLREQIEALQRFVPHHGGGLLKVSPTENRRGVVVHLDDVLALLPVEVEERAARRSAAVANEPHCKKCRKVLEDCGCDGYQGSYVPARQIRYTCGCKYTGDLASTSCPLHPAHPEALPVEGTARAETDEACGEDHIVGSKPDLCFACLADRFDEAQQTIAQLEATLRTIAEEDYDLFDSPVRLAREALEE